MILYIPVNNYLVMSGPVFLGWTSTKQRIKCLAQGHMYNATLRSLVKHSTILSLELLLFIVEELLMFQRCLVMRRFYISYTKTGKDEDYYSLAHAYAVFCGRFIKTVNWDYLYAQLTSVCLQGFSSIFETSVSSRTRGSWTGNKVLEPCASFWCENPKRGHNFMT